MRCFLLVAITNCQTTSNTGIQCFGCDGDRIPAKDFKSCLGKDFHTFVQIKFNENILTNVTDIISRDGAFSIP